VILDTETLLSDDQAITASAASTNYWDLGATGTPVGGAAALTRDLGKGNPMDFLIQVTKADFATLTSLTVKLETDDNTGFSSATTVWESEAIAAATLVKGYKFNLSSMPRRVNERYVRLYYTVTGSNATAGNITAGITGGDDSNNYDN
jgi:hypothetical protein